MMLLLFGRLRHIFFIAFLSKSKCAEACIKVKCSDDLAMVYLNGTWKYNVNENR